MKNYKHYILLLLAVLVMTGCSKDDDGSSPTSGTRRTIMVYFNAENNLYSSAASDLQEMVVGSKNLPSNCNLIVYFDVMTNPVIYSVKDGKKEVLKAYETDYDSSDKDRMLEVFKTMIAMCPADEYATVFWGHGDGPIIANGNNSLDVTLDENEPNSYGADYNSNDENKSSNATWIDIPELAGVMKQLPKQEFIFFDACCMQNIEAAYELRDCTRYLIGATCETPAFGAPYNTTTRYFAYSDVEQACKMIVDDYQGSNNPWATMRSTYKINNVCMSVIKTEGLENLLAATKTALSTISGNKPLEVATTFANDSHDATSCIFYFKVMGQRNFSPIMYDMNDVMLHNLSTADYNEWKKAFDNVVIYRPNTGDIRDTGCCDWFGGDHLNDKGREYMTMKTSDFKSFYLSDQTFGGVSMYFPLKKYDYYKYKGYIHYSDMNTEMYDYEWCREVGWKDLGW